MCTINGMIFRAPSCILYMYVCIFIEDATLQQGYTTSEFTY